MQPKIFLVIIIGIIFSLPVFFWIFQFLETKFFIKNGYEQEEYQDGCYEGTSQPIMKLKWVRKSNN